MIDSYVKQVATYLLSLRKRPCAPDIHTTDLRSMCTVVRQKRALSDLQARSCECYGFPRWSLIVCSVIEQYAEIRSARK